MESRLKGIKKVPCSTGPECTTNQAWSIIFEGGMQMMYGCVCHNPEPTMIDILDTTRGMFKGNIIHVPIID